MKLQLHDYQKEDVKFLEDNKCAGLFLDMGLGKTAIVLQSIHDFMFSEFDTRRTLVVAPKNVALVAWPNELRKWDQFKAITFTVLHGAEKDARLMLKRDLYIINYDGLDWMYKQYMKRELRGKLPIFDTIVVDESTYIKNPSSNRSRKLKTMFGKAPRKIILTGTPSPNGYIDLYGQFDFLAPGSLAKGITSYRNSYFIPPSPGSPSRRWVPRRGARELIATKIHPYVRVRKESDVLPRDRATHNTVLCELPTKARDEYNSLEKEFFLELENGTSIEVFNAASLAMKLRQYIQGFVYSLNSDAPVSVAHDVKAKALKELVEAMNGRPVLCAIQFQHEVTMLRHVFGYKIPALYSKTPSKEQEKILNDWNLGEIPLLLAHPASGGIGLNLQDGGSTMVWYSPTWDLQHYEQFNGRLDRQGQKEQVIIHHLVMKDTVDEVIVDSLRAKATSQSTLIDALRRYKDVGKAS